MYVVEKFIVLSQSSESVNELSQLSYFRVIYTEFIIPPLDLISIGN